MLSGNYEFYLVITRSHKNGYYNELLAYGLLYFLRQQKP